MSICVMSNSIHKNLLAMQTATPSFTWYDCNPMLKKSQDFKENIKKLKKKTPLIDIDK